MGGFDLHDNLIANQVGLMRNLSDALKAFQAEMVVQGLDQNVTSFTASDFGRTLASNGDGTDHGWGSHHVVVGACRRAARTYGVAPPVSIGNTNGDIDQWHVGQGG